MEMNGKMVVSKPLYVALAQRKEDRRARLQVCFVKLSYFSYLSSFGMQYLRSAEMIFFNCLSEDLLLSCHASLCHSILSSHGICL